MEIMLQLATFPEAPLRSRTVGFPESGSGLGSHAICQGGPSPSARNCGAGAPFAPTRWSLPRPFATLQAPRNPAQCPERTQLSWPPSAQSPFARNGRYPRRGGLQGRLERRYPLVVAHTGSCARPPPSPRLRYSRCARGLCRLSPVPAGRWPFPTLSLRPLCRCSDPCPAALLDCACPFLHRGHRPHPKGDGFGARIYPHMAASVGSRISWLQSFDHLRAPALARPPDCSDRSAQARWAARPFTPRIARPVTRTGMWRRFTSDMDN